MQPAIIYNIANLDSLGKKLIRFGVVVVFLWIGGLKFAPYEADGITPFVANSPFLSFFYNQPKEYKSHKNKEGELIEANREWNLKNNTYGFADALGIFLVTLSVLVALYKVLPLWSMIASLLIFLMTLGTLSFLITTPEAWVPKLGAEQWGFPYLSGAGRLVLKDLVIMGAAVITMSESARLYLSRNKIRTFLEN